jgi:hypothetical protein
MHVLWRLLAGLPGSRTSEFADDESVGVFSTGINRWQLVLSEARSVKGLDHQIDCQSRVLQYLLDGKAGQEEFPHPLFLLRGSWHGSTSCIALGLCSEAGAERRRVPEMRRALLPVMNREYLELFAAAQLQTSELRLPA